jgi:hypothetical protein
MAEKDYLARELSPRRVGGTGTRRLVLLSCTVFLALTWFKPFDTLLYIAGTNQGHKGHAKIGSQFWEKCHMDSVEERTLCGSLTFVVARLLLSFDKYAQFMISQGSVRLFRP